MSADVARSMTVFSKFPGYVEDDGLDKGVASHYGDPLPEQRTAARAAAIVDRSNRGLVVVSGDDRLSWLHSLTSQHLSVLPDGSSIEGLILSPHGHVEYDLWFTEHDSKVWIDCEPGTAESLAAYLDKMRFMLRVEVADVSDQYAQLSVIGPKSSDTVACLGTPPEAGRVHALDAGFVRATPWAGQYDIIVSVDAFGAVVDTLAQAGAQPVGMLAFEAMRVEAMRPRLARETDHRTIPHEVGWISSAVHLDKGCYRGQETVARVQNLGRPPRRLVRLHLDGSLHELPAHGAEVVSGERVVGFIGTAVLHFEDGPIALAVIKRNIADGADLIVRDGEQEFAAKVDEGLAV
ncbi:hypothetical protein CLV47_13516 [Antricoccus suffuscus]|uniref:GCVT N-terminal domain-containing protein n=1 Tax=Antricoccus suffuscus TaxID=1629062 RepID=A0A2T0YYP0_9ACTN|nr:folate-binding protein [Antricoccus suffuscus]PRZ29222.1 hypothetical protein CLV47_13516 [Antricoccus suffuscus]